MRCESWVRIGENTDASTSSTSSSSDGRHRLVVVDDPVADRVDDRGRPVAEHGGLLLQVEPRAVCSSVPSPCRTLTT